MKIFQFDQEVGREIEAFGSVHFVLSQIARLTEEAFIGCMHLGRMGVAGYHQASLPQLLLVVQGSGWVRAGEDPRVAVTVGDAVFWDAGEWHETGSDEGLMAIVLESATLQPAILLPEKGAMEA